MIKPLCPLRSTSRRLQQHELEPSVVFVRRMGVVMCDQAYITACECLWNARHAARTAHIASLTRDITRQDTPLADQPGREGGRRQVERPTRHCSFFRRLMAGSDARRILAPLQLLF